MANVQKIIHKILKWEGGWANDPADKGGPTMKGVTIEVYKAYCRSKGWPAPTLQQLKEITMAEWVDILKTNYWDRWKADEIKNQSIAELLVDWVWTSGKYGIIFPQRVLGVKDDGIVGPITLKTLNDYPNQKELFQKLWDRRKQHFVAIAKSNPSANKFLKGWLNRLNDFKYQD